MEQQVIDFLRGWVRIRITGKARGRFLNLCAFHGIRLWKLRPGGDFYEACVAAADFPRLRPAAKKSRVRIRILRRQGFPFFVRRIKKRRAIFLGIAAAAGLLLWLSWHIWSIRIEGNFTQTDDVIFEYLEQTGICHGTWKNRIDCQELSAQLRSYFPQFSWVSSELKGTALTIYVKEGISGTGEETQEETKAGRAAATDLTAQKDGVVESIYVRKGLAAVKPGDSVKKGEVLVSGSIPVYDDSGAVQSYQLTDADADIWLYTRTAYYDELPLEAEAKRYTGREKTSFLLRAGGASFALWPFSGAYDRYELTGVLTQARLGEHFYLPLYLYRYTAREYELLRFTYTKEQAGRILEENLKAFLEKSEEKGVQIFENDVTIEWYENSAAASGTLLTRESAVVRTAAEDTQEEEKLE